MVHYHYVVRLFACSSRPKFHFGPRFLTNSSEGAVNIKLVSPNTVKVQPVPISSMTYCTAATNAAETKHRPMFTAAVTEAARPGRRSTRMVWLNQYVLPTLN